MFEYREKVARLLRVFTSPRKRLGLTPDELLIFFAIGYLGTRTTTAAIQVIPINIIEVSALLGIPKETVRRKITRLAALEYVESTSKGIHIKEATVWWRMLERAVT
ncbi:helix-turn-helix domain-containing protein [Bradyrhizobium sp. 14AA]